MVVPTEMQVHPDFAPVAEQLPRALRGGRGGALAVVHRGELVVDAWSGERDPATGAPWAHDTVAMAWSTTKGVSSTALHLLIQRGLLGIDDRVADHWPEFAAAGKGATTIRHVLTQSAGLYDIRHLVPSARAMLDHDEMAAALAGAPAAHEPGKDNGYHALTYGSLIDELVRRTSGRTLAEVVRTEIAEPLALDGFAIGSEGVDPARIAPPPTFGTLAPAVRRMGRLANCLTSLPPARIDLAAVASAFIPNDGTIIGTPAFLAVGNGSIGGLFTARSLARFYATLLLDDGRDGAVLWTSETRRRATTAPTSGRDRVVSIRPFWTAGFHRPWPRRAVGPGTFGFMGMYGSGAWADPSRDLAVALVTPDARGLPLTRLGAAAIAAADAR